MSLIAFAIPSENVIRMPLDILNVLLILIVSFLRVYESFFLTPMPLLEYLLRLFLFYWFLQFVLNALGIVRNLIYQIWFPFRWLHVYLHLRETKSIKTETDQLKDLHDESYDFTLDKTTLRSSLFSGLDEVDERPGLILGVNRVHYARRIAFAPLRMALVMAGGFIIITLMIWLLNYTADLVILVLHFYLYVGIFVILMPSRNDWYFYIHSAMITLDIRERWINWAMVVYMVIMIDVFWRTQDFLLALLLSMIAYHLYLAAAFSVAILALGRNIASSKLFFYPSKRPVTGQKLDILEEEYLIDESTM